LLSRFAAGLSQSFSPPPPQQQNSLPDTPSEAAQAIAPKPAKHNNPVRQQRPQIAPTPATSGAATAERRDPPQLPAARPPETRDPPLNVAEREALFQDFMKWQLERNVFGRP
jgi:hypothetical protein